MVKRSSLDPIEEARALVRLRYNRARPSHPGPPKLGMFAQRVTRKALPKKAASLTRMRVEWADIVGPQLSRLCYPDKLSAGKNGRRLTLKVVPAAAGLVQHQSEIIRQRVSVAAGGDITELRLVQGNLPSSAQRGPGTSLAPPDPALVKTLAEQCAGIDDKKLRDAIVALGAAVLSDTSE